MGVSERNDAILKRQGREVLNKQRATLHDWSYDRDAIVNEKITTDKLQFKIAHVRYLILPSAFVDVWVQVTYCSH